MATIRIKSELIEINSKTIICVPEHESAKLSSRSQVRVKGTINGFPFHTALDPDGRWSHYLNVDKTMRETAGIEVGDKVEMVFEATKDWLEPEIPQDLQRALSENPQIMTRWEHVTPMARWEWIRWVGGTKNPETRQRRIKVSMSKLSKGEKRPCCFNRAMCTDPYISKGGVLLEPAKV